MKRPISAEMTGVTATLRTRRDLLRAAAAAALVALGAVWVAWLGFRTQVMGDYRGLFAPSMNALLVGHLSVFFAQLPPDAAGGSVLLRAPFALAGKELVGGQHAIFRFGALACVLSGVPVAFALMRVMRSRGRPVLSRGTVVTMFLLAPAVLDVIYFGHPEEVLGANLSIAAVLLAGSGHTQWSGAMLALAIINKPWGALAVLPALLAAREGRTRLLLIALLGAGAWEMSAFLADPARFRTGLAGAGGVHVAHPEDVWWPLATLRSPHGMTPWYAPPGLVARHGRMLAAVAAIPLAAALMRRRPRSVDDALALLALLFLVRCVLDPSNHVYYQLPFVLALAAWEARVRGVPLLSLISLGGFWLIFHAVSGTGSLTAQYLAYMALTIPLVGYLAAVIVTGRMGMVHRRDRHRIGPGLPRGVAS